MHGRATSRAMKICSEPEPAPQIDINSRSTLIGVLVVAIVVKEAGKFCGMSETRMAASASLRYAAGRESSLLL